MNDAIADVIDRAEAAGRSIRAMSIKAAVMHNTNEWVRLTGKLDGIDLVLSYLREASE